MFCFASAKTVGVGDGVGEADEVGSELVVGIGDGSWVPGSDGIGLRVGVGCSLGDSDGDGVGVGSAEIVGSGDAEADGVEKSGAGEFSSANVGAIFAKRNATVTKKIKRRTNLPLRVERRSLRSEVIFGNTGKWYRA
jgi:hypothetical protein